MSATTTPPIPRQPIGTTFIVAICVLGTIALLQIIAVFIPLVRRQIAQQAGEAAPVISQPAQPALPAVAQNPAADPAQPSPAQRQKATVLFAEAEKFGRIGEYDEALKKLDEVAAILPGDPVELLLRGQILERMGQSAAAAQVFQKALEYPGLPPAHRQSVEKKLALLAQAPGFAEEMNRLQAADIGSEESTPMRDEAGLQPGAVLGIVETKLRDVRSGMKSLRVAVKSRPGQKVVDPGINVRLSVSFYEKTEDGEVVITDSQILSQWISQPLDWAENLPEICDVQYAVPKDGSGGRTFYGYTVGVYYNGELQDSRADPGSLDKQFPLRSFLTEE